LLNPQHKKAFLVGIVLSFSSFYLFLCVGVADSFALAPSSPGSPPPSPPPLLSRITNGYSIHALTLVEITPLLSLLVPKLETKDTLTNMREKRGAERHPLEHGSATFNDWARDDDQDLASETETDGANWSRGVPLLMGIEKSIKSWAVIPLPPRLIQVRFQTPGHRSSSHSVYVPLLSCTVRSLFQNPGCNMQKDANKQLPFPSPSLYLAGTKSPRTHAQLLSQLGKQMMIETWRLKPIFTLAIRKMYHCAWALKSQTKMGSDSSSHNVFPNPLPDAGHRSSSHPKCYTAAPRIQCLKPQARCQTHKHRKESIISNNYF